MPLTASIARSISTRYAACCRWTAISRFSCSDHVPRSAPMCGRGEKVKKAAPVGAASENRGDIYITNSPSLVSPSAPSGFSNILP